MVKDFGELYVYRAAYAAAKTWPKEERYSLNDQIRRSSRSVCASIAEAWCKRRYDRHFIMKLSDAEAEAAETQNWISFAADCRYLTAETRAELNQSYRSIRRRACSNDGVIKPLVRTIDTKGTGGQLSCAVRRCAN